MYGFKIHQKIIRYSPVSDLAWIFGHFCNKLEQTHHRLQKRVSDI